MHGPRKRPDRVRSGPGLVRVEGEPFERARCAWPGIQKSGAVWKPGTNFASTRRRFSVLPEWTACKTERGVADRMP